MVNSESFSTPVDPPHDPPSLTTSNRRGAHVQLDSRYSPYAARSLTNSKPSTSVASASVVDDTESTRCTTDLPDAQQSKGSMKDYDKTQTQAIEWAQKRLIMDSVFVGWIRNLTIDEKNKMETRVIEIISHASVKFNCVLLANTYLKNFIVDALTKDHRRLVKHCEKFLHLYKLEPPSSLKMSEEERKCYICQRRDAIYNSRVPETYYLHGQHHTPASIEVLMFVNPAVIGAHSLHWYNDKRSPLCDEEMRTLVPTTTLHMLSGTSAATMFTIDRYVDKQLSLSGTKSTLRYSTLAYSSEQALIMDAMSNFLQQDLVLRAPFEANLLDIHHRGLRTLHKMLNLQPPQIPIYVPTTVQELSIPRRMESSATTLPSAFKLSPLVQASGQLPLTMVQPEPSLGQTTYDTEFSSWFSGLEMDFEEPQASGSGSNDRPFSLSMM